MTSSSLFERLKRRFASKRTLSITRLGRFYLVITIGVGIGALNTGNNLLYLVLGLLLALIIVSGVLSERIIWRIDVQRSVPSLVFAHEPFAVTYAVSTSAAMAFAVRVREQHGQTSEASAMVPVLARGERYQLRIGSTAPARGPFRLHTIEVSTTYPFGFFEKKRSLAVEDELLALPQRGVSHGVADTNATRHLGIEQTKPRGEGTGDFMSLKELQPNENARFIHWKKSAALQKLLRVERAPEQRPLIRLRIEQAVVGPALDRRCEELAAMATSLLAKGHSVELTTPTRVVAAHFGPDQERAILEALAWVGFESAT
jgi:uncharacterized protein (DUF58 family)